MSDKILFASTSSGPDGYSIKKNFLGCGALAVIKEKQAIEDWAAKKKYAPYPEEGGKPVANLTGSMMGQLLQSYHAGQPPAVRAQFFWDSPEEEQNLEVSHPATCKEVRRLYDWYTAKYAHDHWGKFIGQEVPVEVPAELFGERISGAIDLVTEEEPDTESVFDFKWLGREEATVWEEYSLTPQLFNYAVARSIVTGKRIKRLVYLTGFKRKDPGLEVQEFTIDEYRIRWLKNFIDTVQAKRLANRPEPSPSNCISWGKTCQFLIEGKCSLL